MINKLLKELENLQNYPLYSNSEPQRFIPLTDLQKLIEKYKDIVEKQPFVIDLPTRKITCQGHWTAKHQGVIFVRTENEAELLHDALVEQDEYWEDYKSLIVVLPEDLEKFVPGSYVKWCGKTDIYNVELLRSEMKMLGVEFIIYQEQNEEY